jgi:adenylosuccinate lyase
LSSRFSRLSEIIYPIGDRFKTITPVGVGEFGAKRIFVQCNAMPVSRGEGDFQTLLKKDPDVKKYLDDAEIEEQFDLGYRLKHVDTIFKRVFGK